MASAVGMIGAASSSVAGKGMFPCSRHKNPSAASHRTKATGVRCACGSTLPSPPSGGRLREQYRTLRIQPGASESEVKKAFRKLVLQFHPDVCKGSNCVVQFHRINEAYDMVMDSLRSDSAAAAASPPRRPVDDRYNPTWEPWEEWMGFEGACTANPYI